MNAKQLRDMGWLIVFRGGYVIAQKSNARTALRLPIDNGGWMEKADNPGNWEEFTLTSAQSLELATVRKMCYCETCSTGCDYCHSTRRAQVLPEMMKADPFVYYLPDWHRQQHLMPKV